MKTILSPRHSLHRLAEEFSLGETRPSFEGPVRVDRVAEQVRTRRLGEIIEPGRHPLERITAVHAVDYIGFLQTCWAEWERTAAPGVAAVASVFCRPAQGHRKPRHIEGQLGYYSADTAVGLVEHSWEAIRSSAESAIEGSEHLLRGARGIFALCRPAGHHASTNQMAGYCYVNNAAVAAQHLRDSGCAKVAVLDVDYHHGNGTQSIFYGRDDVFFVSIHGDPDDEYPYFLGRADETGSGPGRGFNLNLPLPLHRTGWREYRPALQHALEAIAEFAPQALVVSLGVDTFIEDPISHFKLESQDFTQMGRLIGSAALPTLFVFEGGYALEALGVNTVNVLEGFESSARTAHPAAGRK